MGGRGVFVQIWMGVAAVDGLAGAGRQGDMGDFTDAVAGLRADLADNPLTKGVMSSDQALRGYKAAMDAALGRGSQALIQWIEGIK